MTTSQKRPLRLAAIGCGKHACDHTLAAVPEDLAQYVLVFDNDVRGATRRLRDFATTGWHEAVDRGYEISEETAREISRLPVTDSFNEVLDRRDIDGVVITTHTDSHAEYAIRALKRGLHVHLAKPMARTLADARAIRDAAARGARALQVGLQWAWAGYRIRELAARNDLGALLSVFGQLNRGQEGLWVPPEPFWENPETGGAIFDTGPHQFCLPVTVAGYRPVRITARASYDLGLPSEDGAKGTMEDANGVPFEWETYWRKLGEPTPQRFRVEFTYERGVVDYWSPGWDTRPGPYGTVVRVTTGDGQTETLPPLMESECVAALMRNWLEVAHGVAEQVLTPEMALATERMVHRACEAARSGESVNVAWDDRTH